MSVKIEADPKTIRQFFIQESKPLEIPYYQRPYCWTTEHAERLLMDIKDAQEMQNKGTKEDYEDYFLGSIVLMEAEGDSEKVDILDGQQRLITLTILFAVIRDILKNDYSSSNDSTLKDDIHNTYIRRKSNSGGNFEYCLKLRTIEIQNRMTDEQFFIEKIQEFNATENCHEQNEYLEAQGHILENARLFKKILTAELLEERSEDFLKHLISFIESRCLFVVIKIISSELESGLKIFKVLNTRGIPLLEIDIIKTELIEQIKELVSNKTLIEGREYKYWFVDKWTELEEQLGRDDEKTKHSLFAFFSHFRMIKIQNSKNSVSKDISNKIQEASLSKEKGITEFINEIFKMAEIYRKIIDPDEFSDFYNDYPEIKKYVEYLNRITHAMQWTSWLPPTIFCFYKYEEDKEFLLEFLKKLVRLYYGMSLLGGRKYRQDVREKRSADIIDLLADEHTTELIDEESVIQLKSDEKQHIHTALRSPTFGYDPAKPKSSLPYLKPIMCFLTDLLYPDVVDYKYDEVSVEHILPKNPRAFEKWEEGYTKDEVYKGDDFIGRIGNLAIIPKKTNSKANNSNFPAKKVEYEKDSLAKKLTKLIREEDSWDLRSNAIHKFSNRYCKLLKKVWDLDNIKS